MCHLFDNWQFFIEKKIPVFYISPDMCLLFLLQLKELYTLLNENYVEDDDNMFRFDYSPDFLLWFV